VKGGFLLDTNVPSELTYPRPAPQVEQWLEDVDDEQLFLSVISLAEICKGIAKLPESKNRPSYKSGWIQPRIPPVTEPIAERMGRWAGEGETRGERLR
jgi:toxin FitB